MFVTMVLAALVVDLTFGAVGLIPQTPPSTKDVFGTIELDYKAALNAVAAVVFGVLWTMTVRRGATDPVCGMKVDRSKAVRIEYRGRAVFFCSQHCAARFEGDRTLRE